ncbi:MAG: hypothetical protein L7H00_05090 [Vulcanisaeta sp.]|nr:hypothetical protein [Vulcanisaeta sp.]
MSSPSDEERRNDEEKEGEGKQPERKDEGEENFEVLQRGAVGGGEEAGEAKAAGAPPGAAGVNPIEVDAEFIRRILMAPGDTRRTLVSQWISAHAYWNQAILNLGITVFDLGLSIVGRKKLSAGEDIVAWASDPNNVVRDIVNYIYKLAEFVDEYEKYQELQKTVASCEAYGRLLELQVERIVQKYNELLGFAKYLQNLLRLALKVMPRSALEKFALLIPLNAPPELVEEIKKELGEE